MRKFIIKNFLLTKKKDLKLGLTNIGLITASSLSYIYLNIPILSVLLGLAAITLLYFTFIHFRFWPVKWEELADEQKWVYGLGILGNYSSSIQELPIEQMEEWVILNKKYNKD